MQKNSAAVAFRIVVLLAFFGTCCTAQVQAQDDAKRLKLQELAELLGVKARMERELAGIRNPLSGDQLIAAVREQFPGLSPEVEKQIALPPEVIADISQNYVQPIFSQFDPEELVDIWLESFGQDMSTDEIDAMIAYYKSPVGRKDLAAQQAALERMNAAVRSQYAAFQEQMMDQMMKDVMGARQPR